jgi:hypothetical protein
MHSTAKNDSVAARCGCLAATVVALACDNCCRLAEQKKKNEQAGSWLSKVGKALWII